MFFYDFNNLDTFINSVLSKNILEEKLRINNIISLYNDKKVNLLNITTNMISVTNILDKNKLDDFHQTISLLKHSFESLEEISNSLKMSKNTLDSISSLLEENVTENHNEIKANLVEYNKQDEKLCHQISEYEKNITSVFNTTIELTLSVTTSDNFQDTTNKSLHTLPSLQKEVLGDNNILIVSEQDQKAYLPYKYFEVEKVFKNSNNKFSSLEDVIESCYILPLNRFKNSSFSRFREAFSLVKNKENGSITKALDLGLELMFKYDLNPIIIAACRNLDELDIYLDCLEENELFDFDCFEIKFEVSPQLSKIKKKDFYDY